MDEYAFSKKVTMTATRPQCTMTGKQWRKLNSLGHHFKGLSTPNIEDGHWSLEEMKKSKEDGSDVIDFSDVVPTICDACKVLPDHLKVC